MAIVQTWVSQALIVVAILRWRAYEVEVVLRRSVLAVALLVAGLGSYAVVVIVVSISLGHTGVVPSAVGAAVAIFAFGPLSTMIRNGVNRLFYGRRDDPYLVVNELGRQLTRAADPAEGLDAVVTAITDQLRLPFAEVVDEDGMVLSRRNEADPYDDPLELPLRHQGADVGLLRVGHRRGSDSMTPAETELLESLSIQVGAAVAAVRLVRGLTAARDGLVIARQDERRRIQQDLHDGLSPQLYAVTLKLDAARNHMASGDAAPVDDLVGSARTDIQRAIADVRRLVYALGDPTVTSLGLRAALEDAVMALTRPAGIQAVLDVGELPDLPAATEEAVYRIVIEAVTNVVRHARAKRCVVRAAHGESGDLEVSITDDGCGIRADDRVGVGRRSMNERAAQLGGRLDITRQDEGTLVAFTLPLGYAS
ncbi:MAG: sensor histidine kinase [Acidimicrobiia bacterium]